MRNLLQEEFAETCLGPQEHQLMARPEQGLLLQAEEDRDARVPHWFPLSLVFPANSYFNWLFGAAPVSKRRMLVLDFGKHCITYTVALCRASLVVAGRDIVQPLLDA